MVFKKGQRSNTEKMKANGEGLKEVEKRKCLRVMISTDRDMGKEGRIDYRKERRYGERWEKIWKESTISQEIERELYELCTVRNVVMN